ncbi:MAG: hypothetical protein RR348_04625, partial [Clostridia bacterium]
KGIFWYYFEHNERPAVVYAMSDTPFKKITPNNCNGYQFRISYYGYSIVADFFHAICDGTGAGEFMKSLLYSYFNLLGLNVNSDNKVLTVNSPIDPAEIEDSFLRYYRPIRLRDAKLGELQGAKAYKLDGILTPNNGNCIINMYCDSKSLLELARSKSCTITELLAATLVLSIYETQIKDKRPDAEDIVLFMPINLRKIFPSITLRNFTLFCRARANPKTDMQLEKLISIIHNALAKDTDRENLTQKISTTVKGEKFVPLRILPLVFKTLIFKITNLWGKNKKTMTLSNIGVFKMPEDMKQHIRSTSFGINANPFAPSTLTIATTYDTCSMSFVRCITSTAIEKRFAEYLTSMGLKLSLTSNFWEVDYAL